MTNDVAGGPAPKLDPEALAIRTRPQRAIRFRRGLLVGIAAVGSASLVGVAWVSLKPISLVQAASEQELSPPVDGAASGALGRLPSSYGDVPRLGPPLPGDLGRPILEHQRAVAAGTAPEQAGGAASAAAEAAHEQAQSELRAARQSPVLFQAHRSVTGAGPSPEQASTAGPLSTSAPGATAVPDAANPEPGGQASTARFVAALDRAPDASPHRLAPAPSPYVLSAGSVIPASLITGLRSDLPGLVTAQVTAPVYDSPTGRILLIPQGARLVGNYDSTVAFGQERALVVWQRIIMPDGSSLRLDNEPATDAVGYAGLADKVDRHGWSLLKGVAISTLLGIGSNLGLSGDGEIVRALRQSTQDASSRAGDQITSRNLDVQPTITIRPGTPVRLVVRKDLILSPWPE